MPAEEVTTTPSGKVLVVRAACPVEIDSRVETGNPVESGNFIDTGSPVG